MIVLLSLVGLTPGHHVSASDPGTGDWPMWGGTPDRNMVSPMKGLPDGLGHCQQEKCEVGGYLGFSKLRQSGGCGRKGLCRNEQ